MKDKLINWGISGLIGFLGCLFLTDKGCVYIPKESQVIDNVWIEHKVDTLVTIITKEVPVPKVVYKEILKEVYLKDTLYRDSGYISVPFNVYIDSFKAPDYDFNYKAEVMGELVSFEPVVTVYKDTVTIRETEKIILPCSPKEWSVTVGVSNRLNYIGSVGYKGWNVGVDINQKKFNQLFIAKTFYLK